MSSTEVLRSAARMGFPFIDTTIPNHVTELPDAQLRDLLSFLLRSYEPAWNWTSKTSRDDFRHFQRYLTQLELGHLMRSEQDLSPTAPRVDRLLTGLFDKLQAKHGAKLYKLHAKAHGGKGSDPNRTFGRSLTNMAAGPAPPSAPAASPTANARKLRRLTITKDDSTLPTADLPVVAASTDSFSATKPTPLPQQKPRALTPLSSPVSADIDPFKTSSALHHSPSALLTNQPLVMETSSSEPILAHTPTASSRIPQPLSVAKPTPRRATLSAGSRARLTSPTSGTPVPPATAPRTPSRLSQAVFIAASTQPSVSTDQPAPQQSAFGRRPMLQRTPLKPDHTLLPMVAEDRSEVTDEAAVPADEQKGAQPPSEAMTDDDRLFLQQREHVFLLQAAKARVAELEKHMLATQLDGEQLQTQAEKIEADISTMRDKYDLYKSILVKYDLTDSGPEPQEVLLNDSAAATAALKKVQAKLAYRRKELEEEMKTKCKIQSQQAAMVKDTNVPTVDALKENIRNLQRALGQARETNEQLESNFEQQQRQCAPPSLSKPFSEDVAAKLDAIMSRTELYVQRSEHLQKSRRTIEAMFRQM